MAGKNGPDPSREDDGGKPGQEALAEQQTAEAQRPRPDPGTEAPLAEEQERARLAVEGGGLGTWDRDLPTGETVWNDFLYDLLGRDPASAVTGETFFDYIHPDDLPRVREHVENALESGTDFADEFRVVREDGEVRWLASRGRIYRADAARPVRMTGVNFDVTERKQAEQELVRTRCMLENLVSTAPVGFAYFDRDLRFRLLNERLAEINGTPVADHLGKTVQDIVPELAPAAREMAQQILETGEPVKGRQFRGETRREPGVERRWSESWYPVRDASDTIVGFGVVVEDITERVRAQEALRQSEERYRSIVLDAPIPVMLHALDGEVLALSQAFTKVTGYTRRDIPTYRKWVQKAYGVSADEAKKLEAELRVEHMRTDSRRRRSEETVRTKSGEARTWLVHGSYVRRASDDRGLMVTMGLDITERREAEARIRDLAR
ncbi:MAG: PAS domain S-box protein, partial [Planctomycetota bacterium]